MSPLIHLEMSWCVANISPGVERFGRGHIVAISLIALHYGRTLLELLSPTIDARLTSFIQGLLPH